MVNITIVCIKTEEKVCDLFFTNHKSGSYWIGAHRIKNYFLWSTGEYLTYLNWGSGEPNGTGTCVSFTDGRWEDDECNVIKKFVCEIPFSW